LWVADTRTQWRWVLLNLLELDPAPSKTKALGPLPSLSKDPTMLIF